jgi:multiple sugar transport system permease protein
LSSTELAPQVAPLHPGSLGSIRPHRDRLQRRYALVGWSVSSPALFVIGAVTIAPIAFAIFMSFEKVGVTASGVSFNGATVGNYHLMVTAGLWHHALWWTTMYAVVTVSIELVIGTIFALILEGLTAGRGPMMALLLIPWSLITVISAELWSYIYNASYGILASVWPNALGTPWSATIALFVADIWKTTPFVTVIVLAGLVMIPRELFEASEVDGASPWETFWRIKLPLLRPTIGLAILFRALQAFGLFDLPYVLTNGGPGTSTQSLAILAYNTMFTNIDFGPGAAVAVSTAVLVLIMCLVFLRAFRQQVGKEEVPA